MKRIVKFQVTENKYEYTENDISIFEISKIDLQFDVKAFYNAFFSSGKDYTDIELIANPEMNKDDNRIYETTKNLLESICERIINEIDQNNNNSQIDTSIESYKMPVSPGVL